MKPALLDSFKGYKKEELFRDLLAGLMVALIALPLSMALGIQSVPESAGDGIGRGLITAIVAGFFISALGGSRYQIGGPTAAFVTILFGYLSDPEIGIVGLAIATLMAGAILILLGLLRAGSVMRFFPYPITIGFTTGIGLTLMIGQIKDLCGLNAGGTHSYEKIASYIKNIGSFHLPTFAVGLVGFLIVWLLPKWNKKIPAAATAILACTLLTLLFNNVFSLDVATLGSRYGAIKPGFLPLDFSGIGEVKFTKLILPAIVIAFLCAIESLLSATVAAGMTKSEFDSNQELVGQGVANIGSALLGGLPATGAIARTAAGIENGARSPLCGVFHAGFLLLMYYALMDLVKYVPMAVFAAILLGVALNMSRLPLFAKLLRFGWQDVTVLVLTCAVTVVLDLTYGVLGGLAVAFLLNLKSLRTGLSVKVVNEDPTDGVIEVRGALFFLNVNKLTDAIAAEAAEVSHLCVRMEGLCGIDETALERLIKLERSLSAGGCTLEFAGAEPRIAARAERFRKLM